MIRKKFSDFPFFMEMNYVRYEIMSPVKSEMITVKLMVTGHRSRPRFKRVAPVCFAKFAKSTRSEARASHLPNSRSTSNA